MICCSINRGSADEILGILEKVEMAEIRLDCCGLSDEDIERVFSSDTPLIATCRANASDWHYAERVLALAIKAGARYVDLEIVAPKPVSKRLAKACAEWGTTMIRSYHDFNGTPSLDELKTIADRCRHHDGDIVKIVTTARSAEDADIVLGLYRYYTPESLVAFAMGEAGAESRLECLRKGSPWTYASVVGIADDAAAAAPTAPGQLPYGQMCEKVYGGRKALDAGLLRMPCSKSYAQRAIIAAALSEGTSMLHGYTTCGDNESAIRVAKALGAGVLVHEATASVGQDAATLEITGGGIGVSHRVVKTSGRPRPDVDGATGLQAVDHNTGRPIVNVGESGLLTRLMLPLCCRLYPQGAVINGEGTLLGRPLDGARKVMAALGGRVTPDGAEEPGVNALPVTVPLSVEGPLRGGRIDIDGSKTSQLVSGALMALPLLERNSTISVKNPTSIPYVYMTMDILRKFGIKIRSEMYGGRQILEQDWSKCTEMVLKVKENQRYKAAELDIEGDWSAAAPFMAAGAVFGKVTLSGLDTTSLQADLTMLDILMEAGASLSQLDEPKGVITVQKSPLQSFKADLSNSPDLFPVVSVFCAFCQGRSTLRGLHRLAHKESDRAEGITAMLAGLGVKFQIKGDDLLVEGESLDSRIMNGRMLKGGSFSSFHDHRMVMALRLAELGTCHPGADDGRAKSFGSIEIDDVECVAKSYPEFNDIWNEHVRTKLQG